MRYSLPLAGSREQGPMIQGPRGWSSVRELQPSCSSVLGVLALLSPWSLKHSNTQYPRLGMELHLMGTV